MVPVCGVLLVTQGAIQIRILLLLLLYRQCVAGADVSRLVRFGQM